VIHPELSYYHRLPEQFAEVGRGAQAAVYMLTDRADYQHLADEHAPAAELRHGLYAAPRVLKIALGDAAIRGYVRDTIGITDPVEQKQKVNELMYRQYITFGHVLSVAASDPYMNAKFGYPAPVLDLSFFHRTTEDTHGVGASYSQDYVQPIAQLFSKLDVQREDHLQLGKNLIRQYARFQLDLIPYGLFDTSYKLPDNYGVTQSGRLCNIDFSELSRNRKEVEASIRTREWKQMPTRRESTQLHPEFRKFFNLQLRRLLTPDRLSTWGNAGFDKASPPIAHQMFDDQAFNIWMTRYRTARRG
jgi:hypothetical protein